MADRATWTKRVADWRASGETAGEFCDGKPFSVSTLRWWSSRLTRDRGSASAARGIRVALVERVAAAPPDSPAQALVIELGAARIAVRRGFDRETLAAVLDVVALRGGAR